MKIKVSTWYSDFVSPIKNKQIRNFLNDVLVFLKLHNPNKKAVIKFHESDLWNLDTTLSVIIYHAIKQFREMERWGGPANLTEEKWEKILQEMEEGFHILAYQSYDFDVYDDLKPKSEKAMKLFCKYFHHLWD